MSSRVAPVPTQSLTPTPIPLKAERIQLRQMPGWDLSTNRRRLKRSFRFPTQKAAIAFLQLALATAESNPGCRRGPTFVLRGEVVTVTFSARGRAVTRAELDLAKSVSLSA
ncbi:MAG TPA: 4a-hydroxytetrahydrobiopterin dehydratase [Thermoanaerobaculia bacterium]|nr:4a-hydroxytetrahydrobiopterin dehydratase [Thermoanaerobaculia bacterium]